MSVLISNSLNKLQDYIIELKALDIKYELPDICISTNECVISNNKIYLPLTAIEGIGNTATDKIIEIRNNFSFKEPIKIIAILLNQGIGPETLIKLFYAGTFRNIFNEDFTISDAINNVVNIKLASMVLDKDGNFVISPQIVKKSSISEDELIKKKNSLYSFDTNTISTDKYEIKRNELNLKSLAFIKNNLGINSTFCTISVVKSSVTKYGAEMGSLIIKDDTCELRCFI